MIRMQIKKRRSKLTGIVVLVRAIVYKLIIKHQGTKMSDVVVTVGLEKPEQETRLSKAIDAFARWKEQVSGKGLDQSDALPIVVRTDWDTSGQLNKKLTFPDRNGADAFLRFWHAEQDSLT